MEAFKTITSPAALIAQSDMDTDMILPAQFLLRIDREGLGDFLFHSLRQNPATPFTLDTPPFDEAKIIVGGERFGIGSSREQAVWSLVDFGIRCVIAPSFGEIFYANCAKNGVLAITLDGVDYRAVKEAAASGSRLTIRLDNQQIEIANHAPISFDLDASTRAALESGRDETDMILEEDGPDIAAFEAKQRQAAPWLHLTQDQLASYFSHIKTHEG